MTDDLFAALALAVALEGALYALFPTGMKAMIAQVLTLPDSVLRATGLTACAVGVLLAWLVRG